MNVLDLFSGIGGFSLGLERAGMRTVAFCECAKYCQRVLRKHWPDVVIYDDVRSLTAARLAAHAHGWRQSQLAQLDGKSHERLDIDVICGGFPCQDISVAGKGAGIAGERSSLWSEFARIVGEVRPRYVIVENVAALLHRGIERVLGDLAALGFDAEWHCIPACAVGAPHRRDRVWIVAYPTTRNWRGTIQNDASSIHPTIATRIQREIGRESSHEHGYRLAATPFIYTGSEEDYDDVADAVGAVLERQGFAGRIQKERDSFGGASWWPVEPDVGRVAHGVPHRVDRLRSLGNAVVPQIVEIIGRAIMTAAA